MLSPSRSLNLSAPTGYLTRQREGEGRGVIVPCAISKVAQTATVRGARNPEETSGLVPKGSKIRGAKRR